MTRVAGIPAEYKGRTDGLLEVECWCQTDTVLVAPEDVRNGLTGSCGRRQGYGKAACRPPEQEPPPRKKAL